MAKIDFWWDAADGVASNFDALLTEFLAWRPAGRPPTLAVLGLVRRFHGSALFKAIKSTGLIRSVPFRDLPVEEIDRPDVALIRWGLIAQADRERIPDGAAVLNDTHLNTDKANVEEKFSAVAGYSSFVDPREAVGLAVLKSRANARHDGRVIQLPLDTYDAEDLICQRLVNNTLSDYVVDIRIPFVCGNPLSAYVKFRDRGRRFDNSNAHVRLVAPSEVLTDEEMALCQRFCNVMGFDYGELDILRDGKDGRIYIVDANDTPAGPPKTLPAAERELALRLIAMGFRRHVFKLPC
jgi:hypothetical protein